MGKEKISRNNLFSKKAGICYLQISILIIASFAIAYSIANADKEIKINQNKNKFSFFGLIGNFLAGWMARSKIGLASAESNLDITNPNYYEVFDSFGKVNADNIVLNCCPQLKNTASCQDLAHGQCESQCSVSCIQTKCSEVSNCKQGCCFDSKEGLCQNAVPKETCETSGGTWSDDANCNIPECVLGCCVIGRNAQFTTEQRCKKLSAFYGLGKDFRPEIATELDCLSLVNSQDEGACVLENTEGKTCIFTSKAECIKMSGSVSNFYKDVLCSNAELDTSCKKQSSIKCLEGSDEVYWFDSCGNRENIWSANKIESWNNGKVLSKEESCNPDSGNIESSSCGNCNSFLGSVCDSSSKKCKDLNCKQAPNLVDGLGNIISRKDRKNGESWCVYDGKIGGGKNIVGSRHYRYYCSDGEVKSEPCGDYRTGICVASEIESNGKKFSQANCRPNQAVECLSYNANEENKNADGQVDTEKLRKQCEDNVDCEVRHLDFGENYKFDVCSVKYPIGFDLTSEENAQAGKAICDQADFTCTKVEVKKMFGGWDCVSGCDCDSKKFTQQMNDWCASLGDCGGSVNVIGKTSESYIIKNAPKIDLNQYKTNAVPVSGQNAVPGNISGLLSSYYGWGASAVSEEEKDNSVMAGLLGSAMGFGGVFLAVGGYAAISGTSLGSFSMVLSGFGTVAIGAIIGAAAGLIVANMLGLEGEGAIALAIGTGLIGAGIAIGIATGWTGAGLVIAVIFIGVGFVLDVVTIILGIGGTEKTVAVFNCEVSEPLRGGSNCDKCGSDLLKPCTKYRCSSLGQTCELANEGTGNEICYNSNPNDATSPKISPWREILSPGFSYTNVNDDGFKLLTNGECLQEYQPVVFGITTDNKPSQCKISAKHTSSYDEMENYFGDSSLYLYNHSMAFNMPSIDSVIAGIGDKLTSKQLADLKSTVIAKLGDINFYVRCADKTGNSNINEYVIKTCVKPGPDLTPPYITKTIPADGNYFPFNQNSAFLKVYVSEPASCRYDTVENKYENIIKTFDCNKDYEQQELWGWACTTTLTNLQKGENKIYIRCKDQPWLPEENKSRNIMPSSYVLTLKKTESPLTIKNILPNGTIMAGTEPATAILSLTTEGGVDGKAKCSYSFTGYDNMIEMKNTFSSQHSQKFNQMLRGSYNLYVECEDSGGNKVQGKTNFKIEIDDKAPLVVRVYNLGGLRIITSEDAECSYSFKNCLFEFDSGMKMTGIQREHDAEWITGKTYYIKCRDIWGNVPGNCNIIVRAEASLEVSVV